MALSGLGRPKRVDSVMRDSAAILLQSVSHTNTVNVVLRSHC